MGNQICLGTSLLYLWALHVSQTSTNGKADACRTLEFAYEINGHALVNHVIRNISVDSSDICKLKCYLDEFCLSINFGHFICQLSDSDHTQHPQDLKKTDGFLYVGTENACAGNLCSEHGKCAIHPYDNTPYCKCQSGYTGKYCDILVTNCTESPNVTGVHIIWPNDGSGQLPVYCDQTSDGGGSLYIQPAQQGLYRALTGARHI